MRSDIKALYLAFAIVALSITAYNKESIADDGGKSNPQLEIIKESREKKPVMQTKKWNTPDYGKKNKDENEEIIEDNSKTNDKKEEDTKEERTKLEQKIWNRYKKLAEKKDDGAKTDNKEQEKIASDNSDNKDTNDKNADEENSETQEEPEKQATGIAAILQRYKKSQQSKRNMQTRSFGSID